MFQYITKNDKKRSFIPAGTKIAQMLIVQVPNVTLEVGTIDKDTERGEHGFNSTGVH